MADKKTRAESTYYGSEEDSITSLYEYFGYDVERPETDSDTDAFMEEVGEVVIASNAGPRVTAAQLKAVSEVTISDPEVIESLYPLLTFGQYKDIFNQKDFIYLGTISTAKNSNVNCYVRPGTLPEEILHMLYDARMEY